MVWYEPILTFDNKFFINSEMAWSLLAVFMNFSFWNITIMIWGLFSNVSISYLFSFNFLKMGWNEEERWILFEKQIFFFLICVCSLSVFLIQQLSIFYTNRTLHRFQILRAYNLAFIFDKSVLNFQRWFLKTRLCR